LYFEIALRGSIPVLPEIVTTLCGLVIACRGMGRFDNKKKLARQGVEAGEVLHTARAEIQDE
jgi:hypothetical protein